MVSVQLTLPHHQYQIQIQPGLINKLGEIVHAVAAHAQAGLLVDPAVDGFSQVAMQSLKKAGYTTLKVSVPAGENHKNLEAVCSYYDALLNAHLERKSPIIAMGGGVVGDTAGFVAATYLRGVPFIQCPTTLLAMVDASVGGKVGVNVPQGKNLVGAFYQPELVIIDTDTLQTLPMRELCCGLAECVKHGIIRDKKLFAWIENHVDDIRGLDANTLVELVRQNVQIKANVVMADEKEAGQRAHLNFGHTFAHAIEGTQPYGDPNGYEHGESVSLGMMAATRLAVDAGRCPANLLDRLQKLLDRCGLPTQTSRLPENQVLLDAMLLDKKVADSCIRLVLPEGFGQVAIVSDATPKQIAAAWDSLRT